MARVWWRDGRDRKEDDGRLRKNSERIGNTGEGKECDDKGKRGKGMEWEYWRLEAACYLCGTGRWWQ